MLTPLFRQCLLAAALLGTAVAASAGPTYHVSIVTSGLSGAGAVSYQLDPAVTALPLTATVSNFSSNFGAIDSGASGDYAIDAHGNLVLSNQDADPYALQWASMGKALMFDVTFGGAFFDSIGSQGSVFQFGLSSGGIDQFATFDLDARALPTLITASGFPGASINLVVPSPVPEPSSMLMMMTGLGVIGCMVRRRRRDAA